MNSHEKRDLPWVLTSLVAVVLFIIGASIYKGFIQ